MSTCRWLYVLFCLTLAPLLSDRAVAREPRLLVLTGAPVVSSPAAEAPSPGKGPAASPGDPVKVIVPGPANSRILTVPEIPKVASSRALPTETDTLTPLKLTHVGTYIHVRNGTTRSLSFTLYVECAAGGTGKFDRNIRLAPGDTAIWKLGAEHKVTTTLYKGNVYYRVGLVGKDPDSGKEHRWGLIGGRGMYGKEREMTDESAASSSRHIHVQPVGEI